jgi:hypothetical protein
MTIPEVAHGKHAFWERIDDAREVTRIIANRTIKFYVQPTRSDCVHSCAIDDIAHLLLHLPSRDWEGIGAVLLRQPRRKEQTLASVWGRLAYAADLSDKNGRIIYSGPAIVLEAVNPTMPIKFGRALSVDGVDELDRLRSDGHKIKSDRYHTIQRLLRAVARPNSTEPFCTSWDTGWTFWKRSNGHLPLLMAICTMIYMRVCSVSFTAVQIRKKSNTHTHTRSGCVCN